MIVTPIRLATSLRAEAKNIPRSARDKAAPWVR